MKYVLNETNCIKGTRGLQHILEMLRSFGNPSYADLANKIDSDYNKRMEAIRRQYPHDVQPVSMDRFRTQSKTHKTESQPQQPVPVAPSVATAVFTSQREVQTNTVSTRAGMVHISSFK